MLQLWLAEGVGSRATEHVSATPGLPTSAGKEPVRLFDDMVKDSELLMNDQAAGRVPTRVLEARFLKHGWVGG
jgi:hypothetical protein